MSSVDASNRVLRGNPEVRIPSKFSMVGSEAFSDTIRYLFPNAAREFHDFSLEEFRWMMEAHYIPDEPARALFAEIQSGGPKVRRQFDVALDDGIEALDAPTPAMQAFFATVDNPPEWLDMELVEEGSLVIRRINPVIGLALMGFVGFTFPSMIPGVARTLSFNQHSAADPLRRLLDSGEYGVACMTPGANDRFGEATKTACRLRVMHTAVEVGVRKAGLWDDEKYGLAMSAAHNIVAALIIGGLLASVVAERHGARFTERERSAIAMHCALIAWRNGAPPELIPTDYEVQRRLWYASLRGSSLSLGHVDDMRALHPQMCSPRVPGWPRLSAALTEVMRAFCRTAYGDTLCKFADIPDTPLKHVTNLLPAVFGPAEVARRHVPGVNRAWNTLCDSIFHKVLPTLFVDEETTVKYSRPAS